MTFWSRFRRRSLRVLVHEKKANKITTRTLTIEDKEVSLHRKIALWTTIQQIYMPTVRQSTGADIPNSDDDDHPDDNAVSAVDIPLLLPEISIRRGSLIPPPERPLQIHSTSIRSGRGSLKRVETKLETRCNTIQAPTGSYRGYGCCGEH